MDWNSLYIHSFIYLFILVANNFYETVYVLSKASQNNKHLPHFLFLLYYNVATVVCVGRIDSLVFGVKFSISSLSFFCFLLFLRDDVLYWFESIWFDSIDSFQFDHHSMHALIFNFHHHLALIHSFDCWRHDWFMIHHSRYWRRHDWFLQQHWSEVSEFSSLKIVCVCFVCVCFFILFLSLHTLFFLYFT